MAVLELPKYKGKVIKERVRGKLVATLPDSIIDGKMYEFKNVKNVSYTKQLRAQLINALDPSNPHEYYLIVAKKTAKISDELRRDIKLTGGDIKVFNQQTNTFDVFQK